MPKIHNGNQGMGSLTTQVEREIPKAEVKKVEEY